MTTRALRGRVVLADRVIDDGVVELAGDTLGHIGPAAGWSGPAAEQVGTLVPGLVDLHCHGGGGHSVTTGDPDDVLAAVHHHRARGTTTMLASLVSAPPDDLIAGIRAIAAVTDAGTGPAGSHLEGPFLGEGHCGAHDPAALAVPADHDVGEWLRAGGGTVRMLTLAPELPGADTLADQLHEAGVVVALGHTDADAETFGRALDPGPASLVTHLFNGMAPMHHREPGPVAAGLAALSSGAARVELIVDGTHLADAIARLVFTLAPPDGVVLISDAMAAAGMGDGDYRLGPLDVQVRDGIAWTTGERPSIAGSTAHLADVVRRCVVSAGVDPVTAVRAATDTPARLLGLRDRGRLAEGLRADVLAVDDDWRVSRVWQAGSEVG